MTVEEVFASVLGIDATSLSDASTPENTPAWESLNALRLVVALEETFGVKLTTREIVKMRSVGIVKTVLRAKGVDV